MDELIRVSTALLPEGGSKEVRTYLGTVGLPAETLLFAADLSGGDPYVTTAGQSLLCIGSFSDDFRFYVDIDTGSVYFGLDDDPSPSFANSNLTAFVECLLEVDRRYPFYAISDSLDVKRQAGQGILEFIRAEDSMAVDIGDGFWNSFVDDVSVGDYYEGSL
jgi:hypothetical protein